MVDLRQISKIRGNNNQNIWKNELEAHNAGYCLVSRSKMIENIEYYANDFMNYKLWWNYLGKDNHFEFRTRCYSRFEIDNNNNKLKLLPLKIFSIPGNENALLKNKGRKFEPCDKEFLNHKFIQILIWRIFDSLPLTQEEKSNQIWHVGLHSIRIKAIEGKMEGLPTPEGIHQDGAKYVAVIFINKNNVEENSGKNGVYSLNAIRGPTNTLTEEQHKHNQHEKKFEHILSSTFETILLNDRHVQHDATPISAKNINQPAIRDMLILTFMTKQDDESTTYS